MANISNFYGYSSIGEYVRFFAKRGVPLAEIADALNMSVRQMLARVPDIDIDQYAIFPNPNKNKHRWTGAEVNALIEHYEQEGPDWAGWDDLLTNRTPKTIAKQARRIGLVYYKCK